MTTRERVYFALQAQGVVRSPDLARELRLDPCAVAQALRGIAEDGAATCLWASVYALAAEPAVGEEFALRREILRRDRTLACEGVRPELAGRARR